MEIREWREKYDELEERMMKRLQEEEVLFNE